MELNFGAFRLSTRTSFSCLLCAPSSEYEFWSFQAFNTHILLLLTLLRLLLSTTMRRPLDPPEPNPQERKLDRSRINNDIQPYTWCQNADLADLRSESLSWTKTLNPKLKTYLKPKVVYHRIVTRLEAQLHTPIRDLLITGADVP